MLTLAENTNVLRSKNAGPFLVTFDLMFNNKEAYEKAKRLKDSLVEKVALCYQVNPSEISFFCVDAVKAVKITMPRPCGPSGSSSDRDIYGAQQHALLLDIDIS